MTEIQKPIAVLSDLDFTLINLDGGRQNFYDIFKQYDLSKYIINQCLDRANNNSFTIDSLIGYFAAMEGIMLPTRQVKKAFNQMIVEKLTFWANADKFLAWLKQAKIPLHIVTVGDPIFQHKKIELLQIEANNVSYPQMGRKFLHLPSLVKSTQQVWFIEDNPDELDEARKQYTPEQVLTIWMKHPNSPHINKESTFQHLEIVDFDELLRRFL